MGRELLRRRAVPALTETIRWKTLNKKKPKAPPAEKEKTKAWEPKKKAVVVEKKQAVDPDFLKKQVLDDVWIRHYYPSRTHTLSAALSMHTELAHPDMTNNMGGMVFLDMTLDLTTKKKTKFIRNIGNIVALPHYFPYGKQRRIMVIAQSEEEIQVAKKLGAAFYGGDDLIKSIENGAVLKDEFDYVIATPTMSKAVSKLKYFFKDRLPIKNSPNLTEDIESAFGLFEKGVSYTLQATTDDAVGRLRVPLGPLHLTEVALLENAEVLIQHLCKYKPPEMGSFITSAICTCPPSPEVFTVDLTEYLPKKTVKSNKMAAVTDDASNEEPVAQAAVA